MEIITIEKSAIDRFTKYWPCHGLPRDLDMIVAAFDGDDLIDLELIDADDVEIEACHYEETDALAALLSKAQYRAEPAPFIPGTIERGRVYK